MLRRTFLSFFVVLYFQNRRQWTSEHNKDMQNELGFDCTQIDRWGTDIQSIDTFSFDEFRIPGDNDPSQINQHTNNTCESENETVPEHEAYLDKSNTSDVDSTLGNKNSLEKNKGKGNSNTSRKSRKTKRNDNPKICSDDESEQNKKRKSKYSKIYNSGDISFIRKNPKQRRKKSDLSNNSTEKTSALEKDDPKKRFPDALPKLDLNASSCSKEPFTEDESDVIFVNKLINIIKYPKNKHQQQCALSILRHDEKLLSIFLKEKQTLGKQIIPVFNRRCSMKTSTSQYVSPLQQLQIEACQGYTDRQFPSSDLYGSEPLTSLMSLIPASPMTPSSPLPPAALSSPSLLSQTESFLDTALLKFLEEANIISNDIKATNSNEEFEKETHTYANEDLNSSTNGTFSLDILSEANDVASANDLNSQTCLNNIEVFPSQSENLSSFDQARHSPTEINDFLLGL